MLLQKAMRLPLLRCTIQFLKKSLVVVCSYRVVVFSNGAGRFFLYRILFGHKKLQFKM